MPLYFLRIRSLMMVSLVAVGVVAPARFALANEFARSQPEQAVGDPDREAAAVVDAFHAALAKGDRTAALALLAEDIQIYEQGWVERSRAEYAAHHLASDMKFSAAVERKLIRRDGAMAGDVAYVASESRIKGQFKNKQVDAITLETIVLTRADTGWMITHIHWSSRDADK